MSLPSNVAYHVAPAQLQKFGNTPLPKASQSIGGQSDEDWAEIGRKKLKDRLATMFAEFRQEQATLQIKERKSGDSDNKVNSIIKKAESNSMCTESIKEKEDAKALESHSKVEQSIIQVIQPSCSPNVFEEVCLASDLPIFRFGRNFIVDASIRKILISNFERPMKKGNLLVSNKIVIEHIGQPIVPFIKTDSDLLLQPKLSPLLYQNFISNWVALLVSYLACTWSQLRRVF